MLALTTYPSYFTGGMPMIPPLIVALIIGVTLFVKYPYKRKYTFAYMLVLAAHIFVASLLLVFIEGYVILLLTLVCIGIMSVFKFVHAKFKGILSGLVFTILGISALVQFWRVTPYLNLANLEAFLRWLGDPLGRIWLMGLALFLTTFTGGLLILFSAIKRSNRTKILSLFPRHGASPTLSY